MANNFACVLECGGAPPLLDRRRNPGGCKKEARVSRKAAEHRRTPKRGRDSAGFKEMQRVLHHSIPRIIVAAWARSRAIQSGAQSFSWAPYPVCTRIVRTPALRPEAMSLALSPTR